MDSSGWRLGIGNPPSFRCCPDAATGFCASPHAVTLGAAAGPRRRRSRATACRSPPLHPGRRVPLFLAPRLRSKIEELLFLAARLRSILAASASASSPKSAIEGDMKLRVVVMDGEAAAVTATERSTAKEKLCEYTLDDSVDIKG